MILLSLVALAAPRLSGEGFMPQSRMQKDELAPDIYGFSYTDIDGKRVPLSKYRGKVLMIVNTASKCGLTPQYKELQETYTRFEKEGLVVVGFPANDFGGQEPGTEGQIKEFCSTNYGVSFPLSSKVIVKGDNKIALYRWLIAKSGNPDEIEWNFGKFIVSRDGKRVTRFAPRMTPESKEVVGAIQHELETK